MITIVLNYRKLLEVILWNLIEYKIIRNVLSSLK